MTAAIVFEFPLAGLFAIPFLALLALGAWRQAARGLPASRIITLGGLRLAAVALLVFLLARPVRSVSTIAPGAGRPVMLLLDRSESMALEEHGQTRFSQAVHFFRERLQPALASAKLPIQLLLFDAATETTDAAKLDSIQPQGKRTNLGGALAHAMATAGQPPLAIIALTDGASTESSDNNRALTALLESSVPVIGVGFGSDQGVQTLSLRELDAPPTVSPKTAFSICAHLEIMNMDNPPPFDMLLFRDGKLKEKKTVTPGKGSRTWVENFVVSEENVGAYTFSVQVVPPALPGLKCVNLAANSAVRVSDEKELRILYVQGALTWDYKFISLALRKDLSIKLTGLTRTSKQSVFRQNVESASELMSGFPTSLEELAPFRVVVLSNLRPVDLSAVQQEMLAKFCGELGGGLLMIGGPATFDSSWQNSRLEQLLPVVFAANAGVQGLDRPFRLQLTEEALQHSVFQISDTQSARQAWSALPAFTQYGRVDAPKPGAQVWALHQTDEGPKGRRILMASQRYGAGISAVLCIQNFWRWRLAKDSDPQQFDRFWRQLFRFLSESGRQEVAIHLTDQELRPDSDVELLLEKQPAPGNATDIARPFTVRVENSHKKVVQEETVQLEALRPVSVRFHAGPADTYNVTVTDSLKVQVAGRPIEVRDVNVEFQNTGRDMESLRQWASVTDGLAMKVEDCSDAADLVKQIRSRLEQARQGKRSRQPFGLNGWALSLLVGCLGAEWLLRKRWGLI